MPYFKRDDISLYYEITGEGFPVLLFAPGGMRSALSFWHGSEWNPITALSNDFMVIAMDQRNAGASTAPEQGGRTRLEAAGSPAAESPPGQPEFSARPAKNGKRVDAPVLAR